MDEENDRRKSKPGRRRAPYRGSSLLLEEDLAVAREIGEERQRRPADGTRIGADRSFMEGDRGEALPIMLQDPLARSLDDAGANGWRQRSVDDDRFEVDDGGGGDDRTGDVGGHGLDP